MSMMKRVALGCLLLPVVLVSSCAGKMWLDRRMYDLPGAVLESQAMPTAHLSTAMKVAESLDSYVQPRFEILRDKNFGALRIVYRKHAGLVQLKVDTARERELIANVNATRRDYAVCLLHCARRPDYGDYTSNPKLELLYFNQQQIVIDKDYYDYNQSIFASESLTSPHGLSFDLLKKKAIAALPYLRQGKERRTTVGDWDILMRPVLAGNQDCLNCHTTEKPNNTLGVMVYAVRKTIGKTPMKVALR